MSNEQQVRIITPPNLLRTKVVEGGPGAVSAKALAQAEKVIADMADSYVEWVAADLVRLADALAALRSSAPSEQKHLLRSIFAVAHDMKGQGGSFGYGLITTFADLLCKYVENLEVVTPEQTQVIALHVESMRVVVAQCMKGDGGPGGNQLLTGLEMVAAKTANA